MENEIRPDGTFEEWDKPCPECGNRHIIRYKRVNQHIGAYCAFCDDLWLGWVKLLITEYAFVRLVISNYTAKAELLKKERNNYETY